MQVYLLAAGALAVLALLAVALRSWRKQPVYLLDFECYRPDASLNVRYERFMKGSEKTGVRALLGFESGLENRACSTYTNLRSTLLQSWHRFADMGVH